MRIRVNIGPFSKGSVSNPDLSINVETISDGNMADMILIRIIVNEKTNTIHKTLLVFIFCMPFTNLLKSRHIKKNFFKN